MDRRAFLIRSLPTLAALAAPALLLPSAARAEPVRLRDLYARDMSFSELALSLEGERVTIAGFMAPPLVADSNFYVLTKMPMAVCPFCEPGQTWPDDILAVYARRRVQVVHFNIPITSTGLLDLGDHVDPDLGFYSRVRLVEAVTARA